MNDSATQPAAPELEFLTVKQTAKYLNMSPSTVYSLCETKRLTHYRFGEGSGGIRVNRQELMEFVQRCRVEERQGELHVNITQRPYVLKHIKLDRPPSHPCGATTNAGTPCPLMTREERCHLHR